MLVFLREQMHKLLTQRAALKTDLDATMTAAQAEKRAKLNDTEQADYDRLTAEIRALDADEITPLRVRKVPKIVSEKVRMIRTMFHTFSMFFFS